MGQKCESRLTYGQPPFRETTYQFGRELMAKLNWRERIFAPIDLKISLLTFYVQVSD